MALKYTYNFPDMYEQINWTINIYNNFWFGGASELPLAAEPVRLVYEDVNHIFEPIHESTLFINIAWDRETNPDGYKEFFTAEDKTYRVELLANGSIEWVGWILPEGYHENYSEYNTTIQLKCTDGFSLLKNNNIANDFYLGTHSDLPMGFPDFIAEAMNVIGLGLKMRWYSLLYPEGVSSLSPSYLQEYIAFSRASLAASESETISYYDAIAGLLRPIGHAIMQSNGSWFIYQINANVGSAAAFQSYLSNNASDGFFNYLNRKRIGGQISTNDPIDQSEILSYKDKYTNIRITAPGNMIENYFGNGAASDFRTTDDGIFIAPQWNFFNMPVGGPLPVPTVRINLDSGSPEVRLYGQNMTGNEFVETTGSMFHPIFFGAGLMLSFNINQGASPNNLIWFLHVYCVLPNNQRFNLNLNTYDWTDSNDGNVFLKQLDSNLNSRLFVPIPTALGGRIIARFNRGSRAGGASSTDYYAISDVVLEPYANYQHTGGGSMGTPEYMKGWEKKGTRPKKKEIWNYKLNSSPYYTTEEISLDYGGATSKHELNVLYDGQAPVGSIPEIITQVYQRGITGRPQTAPKSLANQVATNYQNCHGFPNAYDYEATVISQTGQFIRKIDTVEIHGVTLLDGLETFAVQSFEFFPKSCEQRIKLTYVSNRF